MEMGLQLLVDSERARQNAKSIATEKTPCSSLFYLVQKKPSRFSLNNYSHHFLFGICFRVITPDSLPQSDSA